MLEKILYSLIIPLKDEVESIGPLVNEIELTMQEIGNFWELILIDDGSTDGTTSLILSLLEEKKYLHVIVFEKTRGQSFALFTGFQKARGEYIITLDGDGQNDPKDIPRLIQQKKFADMIAGRRMKREDPLLKVVISWFANRLRGFLCQDGVLDSGCSLKLMKKKCLVELEYFDGMHRFLPALFKIEGFSVMEMAVNHRKREKGVSKYHLKNRSINTLFQLTHVLKMKKKQL